MSVVCEHEDQVVHAAARGQWTPTLAAHIAGCPECADVALVSGLLSASEEPRDPQVDLSNAQRIWQRAEIERKRRAADKALLPVAIAELAACVIGVIALVAFAAAHAIPLTQTLETTGAHLLADPVVMFPGMVAAGLMVGAGLLTIVLMLGFGFTELESQRN